MATLVCGRTLPFCCCVQLLAPLAVRCEWDGTAQRYLLECLRRPRTNSVRVLFFFRRRFSTILCVYRLCLLLILFRLARIALGVCVPFLYHLFVQLGAVRKGLRVAQRAPEEGGSQGVPSLRYGIHQGVQVMSSYDE